MNIILFKEDHVSIDSAIKLLEEAKEKGNKVFYPILVDGEYNYKTQDCDKVLKLILSK